MLRFILADLGRMKAGAVIMVLLIALAVALGVTVTLQERALRLGSARAADKFDLVIGAPGSETQLVLSTVFLQPAALPRVSGDVLAALQDDPRVAWAAPVGFGDFYRGHPVIGTTTRLIDETAPGLAEGALFSAEGEAVIGVMVDLALGDGITPTHGEIGHAHDEVHYRVAGRLKPTGTPWDRAILVPIQAVWHVHGMEVGHGGAEDHDHAKEAHDHDHAEDGHAHDHGEGDHDHAGGEHHHANDDLAHAEDEHDHAEDEHDHAGEEHVHDHAGEDHDHDHGGFDPDRPLTEDWHESEIPGVPAILVKSATIADANKLRQDYRANEATVAVFPAEVLTSLYGTPGDARQVLAAVAGAAQALVAVALLLVTMTHIGQRQRQIGALRTLGAPRGSIFTLVWTELFAMIACGVALGLGAGWLATNLLSRKIARRQGFDLPVELTSGDLTGLAVLLGVAALLAALPAWTAYRQSPVASLRG